MLKKRIIACLVVKNGIVVQSIGFNKYLPVGRPEIQVEYFTNWGVDEILIIDIDATQKGIEPNYSMIEKISKVCYVPLTVGGGITDILHIQKLIQHGADKVSVNQVVLHNSNFIHDSARTFGNQCIVASVDVLETPKKEYFVYDYLNKTHTGRNIIECAKEAESSGAGELLVNSVNRDGMKTGLDLKLIDQISVSVNIPIIFGGGVGNPLHIQQGLRKKNVAAVFIANYLHFNEHSISKIKSYLSHQKENIRKNSFISYREFSFNNDGIINRKTDTELHDMRFNIFPRERI